MNYGSMMNTKYVAICHPMAIDKPMDKWFAENEYKMIFGMTIDKIADEIEKWYAETFDVEIPEAQIIEDSIHVYDASFSVFKLTCPRKEHEAEEKESEQ
tara:strand:+ start:156 stop:452 length:297 start_codon:yes stop_codon:yes gene_type:complete